MKPLIIRADANPDIGTGHVMRCLAFAEAWQDAGGIVVFVSAYNLPALKDRLKKEGIQVLSLHETAGTTDDACKTTRIAHKLGAEWVVVDGYQFGAEYQKTIRETGVSLLFIDDYGHADHYYADIVLNQNIYANMSFYKKSEPYTRFLLGSKYVLIRKEFLDRPPHQRTIPEIARKILITLGGSDPDNITLMILDAVKAIDMKNIETIVVAGSANRHIEFLDKSVKKYSGMKLIRNAGNMPTLMEWADIAISSGGSTCWELLYMGVPSLVIPIAANQDLVVHELESRQVAKVFHINDATNPGNLAGIISDFLQFREIREAFSERMVQYVDGKGPLRTIAAMRTQFIALRRAELSDCDQVWQWINDPLVRSVSFSPNPIPLERHAEWFYSAVKDPALVYYIAMDNKTRPIGQVRFNMSSCEAVISVLIDPGYRGLSLGSLLIHLATDKLFTETEIEKVKAFIKTENEVSRKAFIKAGYHERGLTECSGEPAYFLIKFRGER